MVGQLHTSDDRSHAVGFYGDDAARAVAVAAFILDGLRRDGAAMVIATPGHRSQFATELSRMGLDVADAQRRGTLVMLDARQTLSAFRAGDILDAAAFDDVVGDPIRRLRRDHTSVAAYGEMVALLWADGQVVSAFELEELWNTLLGAEDFSLFCAYPSEVREAGADDLRRLQDLHSHVVDPPQRRDVVQHDTIRETSLAFPGVLDSIGEARRFAADAATEWGYASRADDVALVVSELVTNAVVHARTALTIRVRSDASLIRVSIEDGHRSVPVLVMIPDDRVSGRGMFLVDALAQRWGTESDENGKTVWAELALGDVNA
jgi:anti-sigma regulatory factor (Ser/Thr protein kinase)